MVSAQTLSMHADALADGAPEYPVSTLWVPIGSGCDAPIMRQRKPRPRCRRGRKKRAAVPAPMGAVGRQEYSQLRYRSGGMSPFSPGADVAGGKRGPVGAPAGTHTHARAPLCTHTLSPDASRPLGRIIRAVRSLVSRRRATCSRSHPLCAPIASPAGRAGMRKKEDAARHRGYPAGPSQSETKNRRRFSFGHSTAIALRPITVGGTRESTGGKAHDGIHARSESARSATVRQQQQRVQSYADTVEPPPWHSPGFEDSKSDGCAASLRPAEVCVGKAPPNKSLPGHNAAERAWPDGEPFSCACAGVSTPSTRGSPVLPEHHGRRSGGRKLLRGGYSRVRTVRARAGRVLAVGVGYSTEV